MSINRLIKRGTKVTHKKAISESGNNVVTVTAPTKNEDKEMVEEVVEEKPTKNNARKNKKNMMTEEQIASAENMANVLSDTKVIKRDKGLIERTESSKIILTEDNRQLLND